MQNRTNFRGDVPPEFLTGGRVPPLSTPMCTAPAFIYLPKKNDTLLTTW